MTELYIDGKLAVLSDDFSSTVKQENSFFTKNGEYTYDIELKMDNAVNQKIFGYLNRENKATISKYDYGCRLVVDHKVLCVGTLTVTEPCSGYIKAQILSGNSELNYFIGSSLMISFLDLGEITLTEEDVKVNARTKGYPEMDFCLCPICNSTTGFIFNKLANARVMGSGWTDSDIYIPQPYLLSMMKKVITKLGYTIGICEPDNSDYKNLYIAHLNQTRKYNEMIPGWSVKDFLEEIENLLNVVFYLDNRKKTVDILFASTFYLGAAQQHVQNVTDDWEGDIDDDNRIERSQLDVAYDLPDTTYYKRAVIDSDLLSKFTLKHFDTTAGAIAWIKAGCDGSKTTIAVADDYGRYIAYMPDERVEDSGMILPCEPVDSFPGIDNEDTEDSVTCKMIPAAMEVQYLEDKSGRSNYKYLLCCPTIAGDSADTTDEEDTTEEDSAIDQIDNYTEESNDSEDKICLAFYSPLESGNIFFEQGESWYCPVPWTDEWTANNFPAWYDFKAGETPSLSGATGSLRLELMDEDIYNDAYVIDSTHPRIFYCEDINFFDVRKIFIIRNKRYVCKEIEYTVTKDGRKRKWKGTFYPISISDIDIERRWILTDGKWRDGGLWLDDGRWLDG